jgi:putative redox protein
MTSKVEYIGDLRTVCTHIRSGNTMETDAPTDNHGKGDRFSPTDLVATALASCIVTTIAILAPKINITGSICQVEKIMTSNPRKIGEIVITMDFPSSGPYTDDEKARIVEIASTCPVYQSLHPDCKKTLNINWPNG